MLVEFARVQKAVTLDVKWILPREEPHVPSRVKAQHCLLALLPEMPLHLLELRSAVIVRAAQVAPKAGIFMQILLGCRAFWTPPLRRSNILYSHGGALLAFCPACGRGKRSLRSSRALFARFCTRCAQRLPPSSCVGLQGIWLGVLGSCRATQFPEALHRLAFAVEVPDDHPVWPSHHDQPAPSTVKLSNVK